MILWDPILCPERDFRTNFINKTLLNNKLMCGMPQKKRDIEEAAEKNGCVELNGMLFGAPLYREMASWTFDYLSLARVSNVAILISATGAEQSALRSLEQHGAKVEQFARAGHKNAWSAESFSTSEEANFLARATLAFAQTGMTACERS